MPVLIPIISGQEAEKLQDT